AAAVFARLPVVLHEDEVPVLQEALVLLARQIVSSAGVEATVEVQLRAWAARTGGTCLPEVLRAGALHDPLAGHAHVPPACDRLLVGPQAELVVAFEDRDPDVICIEAEDVARELPRELDRLALEVV